MSRMSQLHAELTEQAYDLGFNSLEDALNHGYVPEYEGGKLVPTEEIMKQAHEAWLKEKQQVLDELTDVINDGELDWGEIVRKVEHAIEFIEGVKYE